MGKETIEEYKKMLLNSSGVMERYFGMRLLTTFNCIRCGIIIDDVNVAVDHVIYCPKKIKK